MEEGLLVNAAIGGTIVVLCFCVSAIALFFAVKIIFGGM